MRWIKLYVALTGMLVIGCASTALNPFNSGFKCATTDTGECIPLNEAYDKALENDKRVVKNAALIVNGNRESISWYKSALYKEVSSMLEKPKTPMVIPPKTVRILILPYKDSDGTLYMQRYLYFFASDPQWVLDIETVPEQ